MSCCGQRRAAVRQTTRRPMNPVNPAPVTLPDPRPVRYLGAGPYVVRGAITGLVYGFTAHGALDVAAADVPALLATGRFERA